MIWIGICCVRDGVGHQGGLEELVLIFLGGPSEVKKSSGLGRAVSVSLWYGKICSINSTWREW